MSVRTVSSSTSHFLPSPSLSSRRARAQGILVLPKLPSLVHDAAFPVSGLRTPPVDDMSTTYQPPMASYNSHASNTYFPSLANGPRPKPVTTDPRTQQYQYPLYPPQHATQPAAQQQPQQFLHQSQVVHSYQPVSSVQPKTTSYPAVQTTQTSQSKSSTPVSEVASQSHEGTSSRRGSESLVFHSLQIPKCISPNGGNLAEFAAQMTCLFWFQSIDSLVDAEAIRSRPANAPVPRLPALAKPFEQFQKWVYTVLSTTQVTQNVILLALLFIYRLKMSTPQIKGREGSEYRLLTVALMLGNKFLDDNTYTNKTWAEVSCFTVQEIHVMEVEFLSNMRYNLLASKKEWEEWLVKLSHFHEYYDRALRAPASPVRGASPPNRSFNSPIPSPTATMPSTADLYPLTPSGSKANNFSPTSNHSQNWAPYLPNAVSPLASKPSMEFPVSRKRSIDGDALENPAKRIAPPRLAQITQPALVRSNAPVDTARLPVPQLNLVTGGVVTAPQVQPYAAPTGYVPPVQTSSQGMVSLPPLQPGVRAMSTVYQPPTGLPQPPTVPSSTSTPMASAAYTSSGVPTHPQLNYGTPSKHQSSGSLAPFGSSPLVEPYGHGSAVHTPVSHTPMANSPSVYLQQRNSPYKPIRHVNTLLYPPPSASLNQYHLSVPVQPTQMHYQPLGRRNDVRTGVVPEFVMFNRGQHLPQGHPHSHYAP
ncbi:hypothetical protein B0I35DRAFT_453946 [Stachybotrys elegans]|uniref:Cyclin N-terminal domain-containing protein n=1 Tax=Stachybotrys elegans TaxID=80388 RepID=A0A8K0SEX0_9HYPO|nr:hypothetical protein B0I35DRAFT_453946 [Stachybotrys elegans]